MGLLLCFLLVLLLPTFLFNEVFSASPRAWPSLALNDLSPPPGNSLRLKARTYNGKQTYGCDAKGNWKLLIAEASLVDASNQSTVVGSYSLQDDDPQSEGTWSLSNSPEEYAESGYPASEVSGRIIATETTEAGGGCSNILVEATNHRYIGKASLISYIQRLSTKVGLLPRGSCDSKNASSIIEVPFEAEYWLWTQDQLPPKETPPQLRASRGRVVEGFFAKGRVPYVFNGTSWVQRGWNAVLYDVPGGVVVGRHYAKPNDDSLVWELFNPNGWGVSGKYAREPVQVAENCIAWSLSLVTNSWGNASLLGPFSHVQMVSTRGGMPPAEASAMASTPLEPTTPSSSKEHVFISSFSAIFWFYSDY